MKHVFSLLLLLSISFLQIRAQEKDTLNLVPESEKDTLKITIHAEKDLFSSVFPLRVTFLLNLKEFMRQHKQDKIFDAELILNLTPTDSVKSKVRIQSSGTFRRSFCSFPPILLQVKGSEKHKQNLDANHTLKLINQCKSEGMYESYLLKEYLIYKMFNIISPYSYKVRLVVVTYRDAANPRKQYVKYGFLLENTRRLANRTHAKSVKEVGLTRLNVLPDDITRTALFEYMIGNSDWVASSQHNIKILDPLDANVNRRVFVPHDFDYSGFVNADYAAPNAELAQESVRDRIYLGGCVSDEDFEKIFREFEAKKDTLISTIIDFPLLDRVDKKKSEAYLNEFFDMLKNRKQMIASLRRQCVPVVR